MHIFEWLKVLLHNIMVILFGIDEREITNPINDKAFIVCTKLYKN